MDPNDIWRVSDLKWNYLCDAYRHALCYVDYFEQTADGDLKIHLKKEKKMNKLQGKNIDKIEIRRYGDNVVAKAYTRVDITDCSGHVYDKGWSLVEEASAKCGPNDIFDFNIGAKLAMDRLYEGYDMTPKPKRKLYNGYVVFINTSHKNNEFNYGCVVYKVIDGLIPRFGFCNVVKDLRIEENMTCSSLKKRVADMYFGGNISTRWNKVMYSNVEN